MMAMPRVSNSSPGHDSVDNEKNDFAKSIKRRRVDKDLVGEEEEDNTTDSVSKVAARLTGRELEEELVKLFNFFINFYKKEYPDESERVHRFHIFKSNLEHHNPTATHSEFGLHCPGCADLTPDELDEVQPGTQYYYYCSTPLSYFQDMFTEYGAKYS